METSNEEVTINILKRAAIVPTILWLIDQYREKNLESPRYVAVNVDLQKPLEQELSSKFPDELGNVQPTIVVDGCLVIYFHCSKLAARLRPDAIYMVVYQDTDLASSLAVDKVCSL